ncbi:MAG: ubiquinone biosynthesis regulatory protein kinase UbiB [Legionellaceae bacterium]|nr:ubiquinone biosynthesis regulatory protein kinase UbiB [Legionellaceae bacterium]
MNAIKQFFRLLKINYILAKNGLDQLVVSFPLFAPFRFIVYLNPWNWFRRQQYSHGEALRLTLEQLGPIFVKFGQALSTRPDILSPDVAQELKKLQDKVPPFASEDALAIFESAFGQSAYDVFAQFDSIPLASASMAQVHAATLRSGEAVVVKILRPNMHKLIAQDLAILHTIARWAERYWSEGRRLKPREIVSEFEHNLFDELDLQREAANAGQLRRNFSQSPLLYVPEVYWDYTRENILVMERIHGIPVADINRLHAYGIDIKKLAERGVEIFFTQVFRDCFFHADMHPGNIFVSMNHPHDPQYICIDFGIVGTLNDSDKRYLAENLYAFFNRDYRRVAALHVESGWVAASTRVAEFESAIRTVCEPIFEKPLKDISFAQLMLRLFQVARRFQMEVQPQLVLLQKTLLAIEGLGRQLYPELDLWATAKPFLEKWLQEQMGPKMFLHQLRENLPFFAEQLPNMPRLLYDVHRMQKDRLLRDSEAPFRQAPPAKQGSVLRGLGLGMLLSALVIGGLSLGSYGPSDRILGALLSLAAVGVVLSVLSYKKE